MPFVKRTRATLRSAEFGFFGVCVNTRTQTPRRCGLFCSAGLFVFATIWARPFLTSWLMVGTTPPTSLPLRGGNAHAQPTRDASGRRPPSL
jgi:hypothetical protein